MIANAQLDVPVRLELNATLESDRHVSGVAEPQIRDAGISLRSSREMSTTFAVGTGNTIISADLVPSPLLYAEGMVVTVTPGSANSANAQLDLNGLGAMPIRTFNGTPLDSAVLLPDIPARFVFDGQYFVLISEVTIPCRSGYKAVGVDLCIETQAHDTATFFEAVGFCAAGGARLCRYTEWIAACRADVNFMSTVPNMEWVDSAGNNIGDAKTVGIGFDGQTLIPGAGCGYGSTIPALGYAGYRCCSNR
ncbi:MAG: hypothetical protein IPO10_17545 [Flavobacteriales bacterium]|nr:hypothetical protein [Flavobacteriales bacterium]